MANLVYNYFKKALLSGSIGLADLAGTASVGGTATPLFLALVSNSYSPNDDTDQYVSSLTNVVTPSNFTAYFILSSPSVVLDTGANQGILYASNISMYNVTFGTTVRAAVLFASSALGVASSPLIAYIDFTTDQTVTAGTFNITWASGGVLATT